MGTYETSHGGAWRIRTGRHGMTSPMRMGLAEELRALAQCRRAQSKKGQPAHKCFVEYGRALNHCLADRGGLCKNEGSAYGACWSSWMSCGYYRGSTDCDAQLTPMWECLERQLGDVPGGRAPSPRNFS